MADDQSYEIKYQKGFNEGYLISKHEPDLAEKLSQIKSDNPRMEGFRDGRSELIQEKEHYPQWLKRDVTKMFGDKPKEDKDLDKM